MYKIKQIPEDFKVKEIINLKTDKIGQYGYFLLKKKGYTTLDALQLISNKIRVNIKNIGYAGNKDKYSVTEQYISIKNPNLEYVKKLSLKDIELEFVGNGKEPISLGDLEGNEFEITVRNLVSEDIDEIDEKIRKINNIPNYYDEQRFSINNYRIGKLLLKRSYKEACKLLNDESVNQHLETAKNDFIGALKLLPKRKLMLYVHSVQSFIFNETIRSLIKKGKKVRYSLGEFIFPEKTIKNEKIPVIGFGVEFNNKKIEKIIKRSLKKLKINERDFIFKDIPFLSSEGDYRDLLIRIGGFTIEKIGEDIMNKGRFFAKLKFFLEKGCYATVVVKYLF